MKVILTEKPSVAKDIATVLGITQKHDGYMTGNGWAVTWAFGHLVRLVDPDEYDDKYKQWQLDLLPIIPDRFLKNANDDAGAQKQLEVIRGLFENPETTSIVCATDAGREGELIFRLIYEYVNCDKPIERLWISSQTDQAINEGFAKLQAGTVYQPLYDSAICRAEADWLIGMNASRAYTISCSRGRGVMSVGRVQTPVLKMIVERYQENTQFTPKTYFEIVADIAHSNGQFLGRWFNIVHDEVENRIFDKAHAEDVMAAIRAIPQGEIKSVVKKAKKENPPLLYDLTELQKDANRKFKYSAEKTLNLMQGLYEKHKLLTYPRTSSRYLSQDMVPKLPERVANMAALADYSDLAKDLVNTKLKTDKRIVDDSKVTDHHAIIPTEKKPNLDQLSEEEKKIFDLVVRRFLCVFMDVCIKDQTEIISEFGTHTFKTTGSVLKQAGWRKAYQTAASEDAEPDDEDATLLPPVKKGDTITQQDLRLEEKQTKAPPLYNEASILAAMETAGRNIEDDELRQAMKDSGLGTPATRAQILERLITVNYIIREKNRLIPTEKGQALIRLIQDEKLISATLTGEWEKKLNDMARGHYLRTQYMSEIRGFTEAIVEQVKNTDFRQLDLEARSIGCCPMCEDGKVVENPKSWGCSNWKEKNCSFTIWKEVAGHPLTAAEAKSLLVDQQTELITDFIAKSGQQFSAMLKLSPEGKTVFQFPPRTDAPVPAASGAEGTVPQGPAPQTPSEIGQCPLCGGGITENAKAFGCANWRSHNCRFTIWKQIAGKVITTDIVTELVKNQKTGMMEGFKGKTGNTFTARLILNGDRVELGF